MYGLSFAFVAILPRFQLTLTNLDLKDTQFYSEELASCFLTDFEIMRCVAVAAMFADFNAKKI